MLGISTTKSSQQLPQQSKGNMCRCQSLDMHRQPEDELYLMNHQQDITKGLYRCNSGDTPRPSICSVAHTTAAKTSRYCQSTITALL